MNQYNDAMLVKALLELIAVHLTSDFDVVRWMAITYVFDEKLSPEGQQFVLDNIYIPKSKQHLCDMSQMADVRDALRIRTTF